MLSLSDSEIGYVEGYIVVHGVPIEHAWNTWKGIPFDLTEELHFTKKTLHYAVMELDRCEALAYAEHQMISGPYLWKKFCDLFSENEKSVKLS